MPLTIWSDLKTTDFARINPATAVALLPVGATEQHGPHLPLSTDSILGEGVARLAAAKTGADVYLLPTVTYTKSDEHLSYPGTLTLDAETLLATLTQIGKSVARSGVRKLVILNAHGGNVPVLGILARKLRIEDGLLVVTAGWMSMGFPDGLISAEERRDGIHGGLVETAAMLHFRPDLVDMGAAQDFVPASRAVAENNQILRILGPVGTGWISEDLHPAGVAGNAAAATSEIGSALVEHAAERYALLLEEVAAHPQPGDGV
ncbi:Creatinine amidohydrolase [Thalassovita gelatinovora]|uniref:Creatinine amidohydrolase n=1 Tax=Thalassovita gelatinovora TaxID=53501 RepID=A0A0P1F6U8_THAGE|nr:creatininase family protein [Thalassovita gelatinovora]QIZ79176.1 creatininase family protein [Thalassovita gelatinovora]CUH63643.1 Creatinine amidohydrolase [Thalassovita gelatinovora]SER00886.1 creatinine amidohydrolase [Thalassovita gelatinovora]